MKRRKKNFSVQDFMKKNSKRVTIATLALTTYSTIAPVAVNAEEVLNNNTNNQGETQTQDKPVKKSKEVTEIKYVTPEEYAKLSKQQGTRFDGKVRKDDGTRVKGMVGAPSGTIKENFKAGTDVYTARWTNAVPVKFGYDSTWWSMGQPNYLTVGSTIVFCVDPGTAANAGGTATGSTSTSGNVFSYYSTSQKSKMKLASMYAVKRYNDTSNKDYLYAGQMAVWQYAGWSISGIDSSLTSELSEIKDLVSSHKEIPSFMGGTSATAKTHTLKWNNTDKKYEISLSDSNKVWESEYEHNLLGADEKGTFGAYTIDGTGSDNTIKVTATSHTATTSTKIKATYAPYSGTQYYYAPTGQDFIGAGANDVSAYFAFKIEPAKGDGHLYKSEFENDSNKLAGAKFGLYSDSGCSSQVGTATSDSSGKVEFGSLLPGSYYLKELTPPAGYVVDTGCHKVTVNPASDTLWEFGGHAFYDHKANGAIKLTKVEDNSADVNGDTTSNPLAGATFELDDKSGNKIATDVSDSKGNVEFDDEPLGQYTIKEIKAPAGYELSNKVLNVTLDEGGETVVATTKYVNVAMDGNLVIKKVEDDSLALNGDKTNNPLEGAEFTIYDKSGKGVQTVTTNSEGVATSGKLTLGDYTVKETKAPKGYQVDPKTYSVSLTENGKTVTVNEGNAIVDKVNLGKISLHKVEDDSAEVNGNTTNEDLSGAEFTITDLSNNKVLQTMTTGKDGNATSANLKPGKYEVKETKAPTGYINNGYSEEVTITDNGDLVKLNGGKDIENDAESGRINLSKVEDDSLALNGDKTDNPLANAEFTIYDNAGNAVQVIKTDSKGNATSDLVKLGDYTIKETKAPTGYQLDPKVYTASVTENGQEVKVNEGNAIIDKVNLGKIKLHKVEDDSATINGDKTNEDLSDAEFTITDKATNKVVQTLDTDENGNATSGNLKPGTYTVKETKAPTNYINSGYSEDVTIKDNGQVVSLNGGKDIVNDVKKGRITLSKVEDDSLAINGDTTNNPLAGAEFSVTDSNGKVVQTLTTNEKGTATSGYLKPGEYTVKETKAPTGYINNGFSQKVSITDEGQLVKLNAGKAIINNIDTGILDLHKVEDDSATINGDKRNEGLAGAEFTITDSNGKVVQKLTSDKKGYAKSSPLKYGKYTVEETKAPEGYINAGFKQEFSIDKDQDVVHLNGGKDIVNKIYKGKVELTKIGDLGTGAKDVLNTDKPSSYSYDLNHDGTIQDTEKVDYAFATKTLAGAEFTIYADGSKKPVQRLVTDENGHAISRDLKYGKYTIKETKAPLGYQKDNTTYEFEINADGQLAEINNGLPVLNTREQGQIDLHKVTNSTDINPDQENLSDAEFEIIKDSNNNGKLDKGEGRNVVETIKTNHDGYAKSSKLTTGDYLVHEIKAPTGYDVNTNIFPVEVTGGEIAHVNGDKAIVDNHKQQKIKVVKHDENGDHIARVKFEIYDEKGNVVDTMTTDKTGTAESKLLDYGKYTMKEVEAPKEYIFNPNQTYNFEISDKTEAEEFTVDVTNDLIEGQIQVEKVDKKDGEDLAGAEFTITDKESGKVVDNLKTGSDGKATSKVLPYGTYEVEETKAPEGYQLNSVKKEVTINAKENEKTQYELFEDSEETAEVCTGLDENNKAVIETVDKSEVEDKKGNCEIKETKETPKSGKGEVITTMPDTGAGIKGLIKSIFNK